MSNYYVRREGDNSDYLEHSIFQKGYHGSHKYIARMSIGGKMRYFYDPRELSVFKAGGRAVSNAQKTIGGAVSAVKRKGLGRAVADATGLTARNAYQRAKKARDDAATSRNAKRNTNLDRAAGRAKKAYRKTILGRIENAGNKARRAVGKAAGDARRAGMSFAGSISKTAYDVSGLSAKRAYKEAARKGDRYGKSLQKHGKGRYSGGTFDGTSGNRVLDAARSKTVKRNSKATVDAYNRYMNTPAGVFDRYVGDPINNLRKKVKKKKRQG